MEDYECYTCSNKQVSDFEVTTKFIINHVQKNFDSGRDNADALRTLNDLDTYEWKPTNSVRIIEDEALHGRENRYF